MLAEAFILNVFSFNLGTVNHLNAVRIKFCSPNFSLPKLLVCRSFYSNIRKVRRENVNLSLKEPMEQEVQPLSTTSTLSSTSLRDRVRRSTANMRSGS